MTANECREMADTALSECVTLPNMWGSVLWEIAAQLADIKEALVEMRRNTSPQS